MSAHSEKPDKTKRRSDMACKRCRARKLKCENKDSVAPCKRCEAEKVECIFLPVAEDTPKPPKSTRGSPEGGRGSAGAQSGTPTSPSQPPVPGTERLRQGVINQQSGPYGSSGLYFSANPPVSTKTGSNAPPSMTDRPTPAAPANLGYSRSGGIEGSLTGWGSSAPTFRGPTNSMPSYSGQGHSQPSVPSSYDYSPSSSSSYASVYPSDQQPRGMTVNSVYYEPGVQSPADHAYYSQTYPQSQSSGLPGYPDTQMFSNVPQQNTDSNFYHHQHFSR